MESTVDKPDYLKERIKFETEFFKQLATLFLLIASGTTTVLVRALSSNSWLDIAVVVTGAFIAGLLSNVLRNRYKLINRLIDELNN